MIPSPHSKTSFSNPTHGTTAAARFSSATSPLQALHTNKPKPPPSSKKSPANLSTEHEVPRADFSQLNLSRRMKITVLVIVSIFGTFETIFYCRAIWRWWQNRQHYVAEA
jgi:hypothetical protein